MPSYDYTCEKCGLIEITHSIKDDAWESCPHCGHAISRLISGCAGIITKNKEANQYNDIKHAKYWRDKNGDRHKVVDGDGTSKSPTVTKQFRTQEEVSEIKRQSAEAAKKVRNENSYKRYVREVMRNKKQ